MEELEFKAITSDMVVSHFPKRVTMWYFFLVWGVSLHFAVSPLMSSCFLNFPSNNENFSRFFIYYSVLFLLECLSLWIMRFILRFYKFSVTWKKRENQQEEEKLRIFASRWVWWRHCFVSSLLYGLWFFFRIFFSLQFYDQQVNSLGRHVFIYFSILFILLFKLWFQERENYGFFY